MPPPENAREVAERYLRKRRFKKRWFLPPLATFVVVVILSAGWEVLAIYPPPAAAAWPRELTSILLALTIPFAIWLTWFALRQLRRRDEAMAAIAGAEARLRDIVNGSIQGLVVHRMGVPIYANQRAAEIFGYSSVAELLTIESLDETIAPEDLARMHGFQQARARGEPAPEIYEFQGIRKDGTPFWVETRVTVIPWEGGPATLATVFDVTQRHGAEAELRANQGLLRAIFDTIPYALYVKGTDGHYLMANRAMAERWGVQSADIVGRTIARPDLEKQEEEQAIAALDAQVMTGGVTVDHVIDRTLPNGQVAKIRQLKSPLRDDEGKLIGIVGLGEDVTARHRAEAQILVQQQLLSQMINAIPLSIFVKGLDGRFLMVNETNARLNGLPQEALVGLRLTDLPQSGFWDLQALEAMDRKILLEGAPLAQDILVFTLPDGRRQSRSMVKVPLRDPNGNLTGILGISEDITQRLETDLALRESEQRFKDFSEAASDWYWEMDANLRYTSVTGQTYLDLFEDPAMLVGKTPWDVRVPPEERETRQKLRGWLENRQPVRGRVLRVYGRDGAIKTIRYNGVPIFDAAGVFQGYRGTGSDISEEFDARQRADLAAGRLADAVNAIPAGIMLWDANQRLVMFNERVSRILQDGKSWLYTGMTFTEFARRVVKTWANVPEDQWEVIAERRSAMFQDPLPLMEIQRVNGTWAQIREFRTTEGGLVSIQFDITDVKEREAELRQAQRLETLGQMTGGIAHDFNNLMQVVLGYVALAAKALRPEDPTQELLGHIRGAGRRAAELTQQLLAFSRKQVLRLAPLDLNRTVSDQAEMLRRVLGQNIRLETRLDPTLEACLADRGMIEQVLMNLAVNARDAMPEGGTITLSTERGAGELPPGRENGWTKSGHYAVLRCADTGTGMEAHVKERAFEPFFTTKAPGKGTGLGLAMVYGIVQQHGGAVFIDSEPGKGTTVSVYLPLPEALPAGAPRAARAAAAGNGRTILLAEDADAIRDLMSRVLADAGYHVLEAADGREAVEMLRKRPHEVDLALLDVVMPNMGGLKAHDQIAKVRPDLPVVFCSGWYDTRDQEEIDRRGVALIMKPSSAEELLQVVGDALARKETRG